jgi:hypothetical protein
MRESQRHAFAALFIIEMMRLIPMLLEIGRSEIIFRVSVDLEAAIILLSSSLSGYKERVGFRREDIMALSELDRWDGDDSEFDEAQGVVQTLRQYALPSSL